MKKILPRFLSRGRVLMLGAALACVCALGAVGVVVVFYAMPENQHQLADKNLKEQIKIHRDLATMFASIDDAEGLRLAENLVRVSKDRLKVLADEFNAMNAEARATALAGNAVDLERARIAHLEAKRTGMNAAATRRLRPQP